MSLFELWISQSAQPVMGLLGHMVALFLLLRNLLHTALHRGCINLHSHQQYKRLSEIRISDNSSSCSIVTRVTLTELSRAIVYGSIPDAIVLVENTPKTLLPVPGILEKSFLEFLSAF